MPTNWEYVASIIVSMERDTFAEFVASLCWGSGGEVDAARCIAWLLAQQETRIRTARYIDRTSHPLDILGRSSK